MPNGDNQIDLPTLRAWGAMAIPPSDQPVQASDQTSINWQDLGKLMSTDQQSEAPEQYPQFADLAAARSGVANELQDPSVRQRLHASIMAEVGDQGPAAKLAYIESVMNRSLSRGMSLHQTISDSRYYPDSTISRLGRRYSGSTADELDGLIGQALSGSNTSNYATGNESGGVRSGGAPITFNPGTGERFVLENADRGWVSRFGLGQAAPQRIAQANIPSAGRTVGGITWQDLSGLMQR